LDRIAQTAEELAPGLETTAPTTTPAPTPARFENSDILTSQDQMDRLTKLINENSNEDVAKNAKWKRCWTFDHSFDNWERFWEQCGDQAQAWGEMGVWGCGEDRCKTITILKREDGKIIGGYGSKTWKRVEDGGYALSVPAPNSFLFTLGDNADADHAFPSQSANQRSTSKPLDGGPQFDSSFEVGFQGPSTPGYTCNEHLPAYRLLEVPPEERFCPPEYGIRFAFLTAEVFMLNYT